MTRESMTMRDHIPRIIRTVCICLMLFSTLSSPGYGQQIKTPSDPPVRNPMLPEDMALKQRLEQLRDQRTSVADAADMEEGFRKSVLKHLDAAIRNLESVESIRRQQDELAEFLSYAPQRLQQIRIQLDKTVSDGASLERDIADSSLKDAERRLAEVEAAYTAARSENAKWEEQLQQQEGFVKTLPQKIAVTRTRLQEVASQLVPPQTESADPLLKEAKTEELQSEKARLLSEISLYEKQVSANDILAPFYMAELDLAARKIALYETSLTLWRNRVQELRQESASQSLLDTERARQSIRKKPPIIEEQYDVNIRLGRQLEQLILEETQLQQRLDGMKELLSNLDADMSLARKRLEDMTITETMGLALREQRQSLPTPETYEADAVKYRLRLIEIQESRAEADRMHRRLLNVGKMVQEIVDSVGDLSGKKRETIASEVHELLLKRREIVDRLQTTSTRIIRILSHIDYTQQQILLKAEAFAEFLDRYLLWLRSSKPIRFKDVSNAWLRRII